MVFPRFVCVTVSCIVLEVTLNSAPQTIPFDVVKGTKLTANGNFTFGFINAMVNSAGGQVNASRGTLDFGNLEDGEGVGGTGTTNGWSVTAVSPFPIVALGTIFGARGSDANNTFYPSDRTYFARAIGALPAQSGQPGGAPPARAAITSPPVPSDALGMNNLGSMYLAGRGGLPQDDALAVNWYRKAAEAGDGLGMNNLGLMYLAGRGGLPHDDALAVNWFRKAAEAGDGGGMAGLGAMYAQGKGGLPKDEAQAVNWFRKAVEKGDATGMTNLGTMYEHGRGGLPKDDVQAMIWYRKAAEAGDALGMTRLAVAYVIGQGGLPKDEVQAVNWYRKAAEAGDALGMTGLGIMYMTGQGGLAQDYAQARFWLEKAAAAGNTTAKANLEKLPK
jgi:TPR repeat protein